MRKSSAVIQLRQSLADMKKGGIKYVSLDSNLSKKCYLCGKKTKLCKCVDCKVCGTLLKKNQKCTFCKKKNKVNLVISNAELNALEDLGVVNLKVMFQEKRGKEVEEWQDKCREVWHRLVRKIDK